MRRKETGYSKRTRLRVKQSMEGKTIATKRQKDKTIGKNTQKEEKFRIGLFIKCGEDRKSTHRGSITFVTDTQIDTIFYEQRT